MKNTYIGQQITLQAFIEVNTDFFSTEIKSDSSSG